MFFDITNEGKKQQVGSFREMKREMADRESQPGKTKCVKGSPKGDVFRSYLWGKKMTEMNSFYFKEMEKIPLLSVEEEKTLAAKAFSGDKSAQNKLVEANLRFVVTIANKYQGYMEIEDLINEGNLGLMHAATKYNPATGNRFNTYAMWWIKAYIQKAIREKSKGIKFPANKFDEMKKSKWNILSLDKTVGDAEDEDTTLMSFIKDDKFLNAEDLFLKNQSDSQMKKLLNTLNQKERTVLIKRYGLDGKEPMSLSEVGTLLGYSKERIRQLEKKALLELEKNVIGSKDYAGLAA